MMDDVVYKLKMDPVDRIRNMTRMSRDEVPYTNHTFEECVRRGAALFELEGAPAPAARCPTPGRSSAEPAFRSWPSYSGLGQSSAVMHVDGAGHYTVFVGVTDVALARRRPWG